MPKHENLTTVEKYCGKEEKLLLRSNFSSFSQYFAISLTSRVQLHINLLNVVVRICFLNSATLICRSTDISKYLRESLGIRDNESRLYFSKIYASKRLLDLKHLKAGLKLKKKKKENPPSTVDLCTHLCLLYVMG